MDERSRTHRLIIAVFLLVLYLVVVLYAFFGVIDYDRAANFWTGLSFAGLSFVLAAALILFNITTGSLKIGFFAPLVAATVIYGLVINAFNFLLMDALSHPLFLLVHLVLLFLYCLAALPLYYMGRRQ